MSRCLWLIGNGIGITTRTRRNTVEINLLFVNPLWLNLREIDAFLIYRDQSILVKGSIAGNWMWHCTAYLIWHLFQSWNKQNCLSMKVSVFSEAETLYLTVETINRFPPYLHMVEIRHNEDMCQFSYFISFYIKIIKISIFRRRKIKYLFFIWIYNKFINLNGVVVRKYSRTIARPPLSSYTNTHATTRMWPWRGGYERENSVVIHRKSYTKFGHM